MAHCTCGDSIDVRSGFKDTIEYHQALWGKNHRGEGCGPATPNQAAAAGCREIDAVVSSEIVPTESR